MKRPREPPKRKNKRTFVEMKGGVFMTAEVQRKERMENIIAKFLSLTETDKSFITGYLMGIEEERTKWQKNKQEELIK